MKNHCNTENKETPKYNEICDNVTELNCVMKIWLKVVILIEAKEGEYKIYYNCSPLLKIRYIIVL